jgi:sortase (surface protein transpeptidase)
VGFPKRSKDRVNSEPGKARRINVWFAIAAAFVLSASTFFALAGIYDPRPPPAPSTNAYYPTTIDSVRSNGNANNTGGAEAGNGSSSNYLARSLPVSLSIPSIGVTSNLSLLGLNADGTVQVPNSWTEAGWYQFGPTPGQQGSAVILGHVDSVSGPAVFYELGSLVPGDIVQVSLADGTVVQFRVSYLASYVKSAFPARLVYGNTNGSTLNLVTCGGSFDSSTHQYLSNTVVYTTFFSSAKLAR